MGETLKRTKTVLDIQVELKVAEQKLEELKAKQLPKKEETKAMRELGLQRTVDKFLAGYGQGKLPFSLGKSKTIMDVIPGNMVVNAAIVAMVLGLMNAVLCLHYRDFCNEKERQLQFTTQLGKFMEPYLLFEGR
ncbi:hypothetical protein MKW94_025162 [Papaver nudicaule]|uniref:Uncharacterized protein n=1 Tax=Papaver nudicaule TaxID=74823 RepID=A0AA41W0P6_PAPNU|nr:hypothetical protein [Papaver nudicaule]